MPSRWAPEPEEVPRAEVVALQLEPSPHARRGTPGTGPSLGAGTGPTAAMGNACCVAAEMVVKRFIYLPVSLAASNNNFVEEGLSKTI